MKKSDIEIGNIVLYKPPKKKVNTNSKYINDACEKDIVLNNDSIWLKVNKWKVLKIHDEYIEIIPSSIPLKRIKITGVQGYNNNILFLNNICNQLYGNKNKRIIARNISLEDIENIIIDIGNEKELNRIKESNEYFGKQHCPKGYKKEYSWYPIIYESEYNSVINNKCNKKGLKMNESMNEYIEDKKQAKNSIAPYKSFYRTINYKDTIHLFDGKNNIYKKLLFPFGPLTNYWIASRCIGNGLESAHFDIRRIKRGILRAARMYDSKNIVSSGYSCLFPVVTINISLLKQKSTGVLEVI